MFTVFTVKPFLEACDRACYKTDPVTYSICVFTNVLATQMINNNNKLKKHNREGYLND